MHSFASTYSTILFYLDPGTGSLVIQLLLGALLGIGLAVRIFWKRIKVLFNKKPEADAAPQTEEDDPE